jgi:hypothetical protein
MISQPWSRQWRNDRATAIVALLVLAVACASTARFARASVFKTSAVLCDGVDDDAGSPVLCGLPEETTKDLSSTKARTQAVGKVDRPVIGRARAAAAEGRLLTPRLDSSIRLKRPFSPRAGSADDPDVPH